MVFVYNSFLCTCLLTTTCLMEGNIGEQWFNIYLLSSSKVNYVNIILNNLLINNEVFHNHAYSKHSGVRGSCLRPYLLRPLVFYKSIYFIYIYWVAVLIFRKYLVLKQFFRQAHLFVIIIMMMMMMMMMMMINMLVLVRLFYKTRCSGRV